VTSRGAARGSWPRSAWTGEGAARPWLLGAVLVLAAVVSYACVRGAGFVWDDDVFLTDNPLIRASDGLRRFWFTGEPTDYWPVTSSTLWLEWRLWGHDPLGYHVTNLMLHCCEVVLVWRILERLKVPGAFVAAAVFAVHPVNVETVAWITQRKNLMAMLFYLASIRLFLAAEEAPPGVAGGRSRSSGVWLALSLAAFVLAMLGKGSVAMEPVVLLGIVAWRRPVTRGDWLRIAPFFAASAVLVVVNFNFTVHAADAVARTAGLGERILGAGAVVWFYLYKAYLPLHLAFVYPMWTVRASDPRWWLPLGAAACLTALLWARRRRWGRGPLYAWGYFCVSLVPVMGFTDVYFMRYSLVADHYAHLALIGAIAPAAAGFTLWRRRAGAALRRALDVSAVVAVAALGWLTWRQCAMYTGLETLWRTTIARSPESWMAYNNLANVLLSQGRFKEAESVCRTAVGKDPNQPEARSTLGIALGDQGRLPEAIVEYRAAIALKPKFVEAYNNLGNALLRTGRVEEAILNFRMALYYKPRAADALNNLGAAYFDEGRVDDAVACFQRALAIRGDYAEAHVNLGIVYLDSGRIDEAIAQLRQALEINPCLSDARERLAGALRVRAGAAGSGPR
jgi:tetratricopeptide (TPR) repeat protein